MRRICESTIENRELFRRISTPGFSLTILISHIDSLAAPSEKIEIQSLLTQCQLPADDITSHLANFVVARAEGKIIGVVGLEVCGEYGLLRSLAVVPKYRNHGVARILHSHIFAQARRNNLTALYLLTTLPQVMQIGWISVKLTGSAFRSLSGPP